MQTAIQNETETIYSNQKIKITHENFQIKYYENNELKTTTEKKYYTDVKIIYDETKEKYYLLDTENSCIDIYTKEHFTYMKSEGRKVYWEEFLKHLKLQYFENKSYAEDFKKIKLFYPMDFILKENAFYIWDTRNFRIVKIETENFTEESFLYLEKEVNK
ncbi:MAG: hypothetical protein ACQESP_01230, partial [Candidatus Muiribacteriota bacterium]